MNFLQKFGLWLFRIDNPKDAFSKGVDEGFKYAAIHRNEIRLDAVTEETTSAEIAMAMFIVEHPNKPIDETIKSIVDGFNSSMKIIR